MNICFSQISNLQEDPSWNTGHKIFLLVRKSLLKDSPYKTQNHKAMAHVFIPLISSFNVIRLKKKLFPINLINSEEIHNPSKPIQMKVKGIIRLPLCKMVLS